MDLFFQIISDRTGGNVLKLRRGGKGLSRCDLDQTLGKISSWRGWSSIGMGFQGKCPNTGSIQKRFGCGTKKCGLLMADEIDGWNLIILEPSRFGKEFHYSFTSYIYEIIVAYIGFFRFFYYSCWNDLTKRKKEQQPTKNKLKWRYRDIWMQIKFLQLILWSHNSALTIDA